jgi:hypothetical protein
MQQSGFSEIPLLKLESLDDLQSLIDDGIEEGLELEYKSHRSLATVRIRSATLFPWEAPGAEKQPFMFYV